MVALSYDVSAWHKMHVVRVRKLLQFWKRILVDLQERCRNTAMNTSFLAGKKRVHRLLPTSRQLRNRIVFFGAHAVKRHVDELRIDLPKKQDSPSIAACQIREDDDIDV